MTLCLLLSALYLAFIVTVFAVLKSGGEADDAAADLMAERERRLGVLNERQRNREQEI